MHFFEISLEKKKKRKTLSFGLTALNTSVMTLHSSFCNCLINVFNIPLPPMVCWSRTYSKYLPLA